MDIKSEISGLVSSFVKKNYNIETDLIDVQLTRKEFQGDLTVVLFPFYKKIEKNKIKSLGESVGDFLIKSSNNISNYNIVGGFLNIQMY